MSLFLPYRVESEEGVGLRRMEKESILLLLPVVPSPSMRKLSF